MSILLSDIRHSVRSLRRRPLFTAVILLTLALGIGANTAIFSVVNGVLLRPLPYQDPAELALIWSRWNNFDKTWLSDAEYLDYQQQDRLFQDVASFDDNGEAALTGDGAPESVPVARMTRNLLPVLGVSPALGRGFSIEEDAPNGPPAVMLAYNLWKRRYGEDRTLVGRTILVDGAAATVVGVLPRTFRFPLQFQSRSPAQIVTPLGFDPANTSRGSHGYYAIARLKPGITTERVTAELGTLTRQWTEQGLYPASMQFTAFAVPVIEEVSGNVRPALLVLLGAVGLLLLITCANVANLLLTRADSRTRDLAVRVALGANSRRILRLALTESVVLSVVGGVIGLALAWVGVRVLAAGAPTSVPRVAELGVSPTVLGFNLGLSVLTGLLFGVAPALRGIRVNLVTSLKDGARGGSDSRERKRGRSVLVAAEMALAVVLVVGAGLLVRSFGNLMKIDPGFDPHNALKLKISLPAAKYPGTEELVRFYQQLGDEVRALPGVEAAGFVRVLPIAEEIGDAGTAIENKPLPPGEPNRSADWQVVTPGYFEAMRMRLVQGRFFDATDVPDGIPVIAINETLAKQYFPGENPLGQRIRVGGPTRPWRTIVGVIGDVHHAGLLSPVKRKWFIPHNQFATAFGGTSSAMTLVVRTRGDPHSALDPVQRLIHQRDPDLPITAIATMDEVLAGALQERRFTMTLMAGFAVLALILAAVGIYGVMSYQVSQRTQEIGIRLAMGAEGRAVGRMVVRQGMTPAIIGVLAGLVAAAGLTRFLGSLLYGVTAHDPLTYATIPLALIAIALVSTIVPAWRATRVNPVEALRYE